jgi:hypothetical protein
MSCHAFLQCFEGEIWAERYGLKNDMSVMMRGGAVQRLSSMLQNAMPGASSLDATIFLFSESHTAAHRQMWGEVGWESGVESSANRIGAQLRGISHSTQPRVLVQIRWALVMLLHILKPVQEYLIWV